MNRPIVLVDAASLSPLTCSDATRAAPFASWPLPENAEAMLDADNRQEKAAS